LRGGERARWPGGRQTTLRLDTRQTSSSGLYRIGRAKPRQLLTLRRSPGMCRITRPPQRKEGADSDGAPARSIPRRRPSVFTATVNRSMLCNTNIIRGPAVIRLPAVESVTSRKSFVYKCLRRPLAVRTLTGGEADAPQRVAKRLHLLFGPISSLYRRWMRRGEGRSGYARSSPSFFRYVRHPRISGSVRCALHPA